MKNIKEIIRGNAGTILRFIDKKSHADVTYLDNKFRFSSTLVGNIEGTSTGNISTSDILTIGSALNFGSIVAGATAELTISLSGILSDGTWNVFVSPVGGLEAGLVWSAYISADDEVTIRVYNSTAGAVDPVSATWNVTAFKMQ